MNRLVAFRRSALLVPLLLALSACGTTNRNLVTGESQRGAYSWAQEVQLGTESDRQIQAQFGVYDDPALTAYVNRIAEDVLSGSAYTDPSTPAEIRNTPFYFRVLDSPVVNAFALPGGYVYVTRGLLAYLDNEAQLAVVLGHEIGHVLARHSSVQAQKAQYSQLGLLGATIVGGVVGGGRVAEGIAGYGGQGLQLLQLKYGRGAEREADQAGVAYAEFSGYDATEGAEFFVSLQRLGADAGQSVPNFLSTHPDPGERAQTIPRLANSDPRYTGTAVRGPEYLREIEGIVVGEDPRQGFTENGRFYHPELRFTLAYPRGWQTQNSPQAFVMGEPNGQAVIQLTLAQGATTAEGAARALAGQQGVQVQTNRAVTVGTGRAFRVEGTAAQQNGSLGFSATFVEYGGTVYQIMGLTSSANLRQYVDAFRSTADSFDQLTDRAYLNRQPSRLEVVTTRGSTTLRSLLRGRTLPGDVTEQNVAIMNQIELGATIPAGSMIKLPE